MSRSTGHSDGTLFRVPAPHPPHIHPTPTPHPPYIHPTSTPHPPYIHPTSTSHPPYTDPTLTLHRPVIDPKWHSHHMVLGEQCTTNNNLTFLVRLAFELAPFSLQPWPNIESNLHWPYSFRQASVKLLSSFCQASVELLGGKGEGAPYPLTRARSKTLRNKQPCSLQNFRAIKQFYSFFYLYVLV